MPLAVNYPMLLDNANRANEDPLSNGGMWAHNWSGEGSRTARVVSNQIIMSASASGPASVYSVADVPSADCQVYHTVVTAPAVGAAVILLLRMVNPGASYSGYLCIVQFLSSPDQWNVAIGKSVNGAYSTVANLGLQTLAPGGGVAFVAQGSTLGVFFSSLPGTNAWGQVGTTTDTDIAGAGKLGFYVPDTTTVLDEIGGGPLSSTVNTTLALVGGAVGVAGAAIALLETSSFQHAALLLGPGTVGAVGSAVTLTQSAVTPYTLALGAGAVGVAGASMVLEDDVPAAQGVVGVVGGAMTLTYTIAGTTPYVLTLGTGTVGVTGADMALPDVHQTTPYTLALDGGTVRVTSPDTIQLKHRLAEASGGEQAAAYFYETI